MQLQNPKDFKKSLNESSDVDKIDSTIIANYSMNIVDNYPPDSSEEYKKYRKILLEDEEGDILPQDIMSKEYLENVDKVCISYTNDVATKFNISDKNGLQNIIGTLWWEYWFGEGLTSSDTRSVASQLTKILNADSATNETIKISHKRPIGATISDVGAGGKEYNTKDVSDLVWKKSGDSGEYADYKLGTIKRLNLNSTEFTVSFGPNQVSKNATSLEHAKNIIDTYTEDKTKLVNESKSFNPDEFITFMKKELSWNCTGLSLVPGGKSFYSFFYSCNAGSSVRKEIITAAKKFGIIVKVYAQDTNKGSTEHLYEIMVDKTQTVNESVDKSNLQSTIADIIQSEIYLRDVPYSRSDEKDMEVDPDSITDAAKKIMLEISPMLNESNSLNENCYIIDLKEKKIIETGNKKQILNFNKFTESYNNGPRYIAVTDNELKTGNFYINPNEYKN